MAKLFKPLIDCDTASLRALNVGALCLICPLTYGILRTLRSTIERRSRNSKAGEETLEPADSTVINDANAALNITLFPPLFFFSALFYTDVMSTLMVLLSYSALLKKKSTHGGLSNTLKAVFIGVIALLFRQTNIFWVAIFPAGLSIIDALKASARPQKENIPVATIYNVLQKSWEDGVIHDCSVLDAGLPGANMFLLLRAHQLIVPKRLHSVNVLSLNRSTEETLLRLASRLSISCPPRLFWGLCFVERKCRAW